MRKLLSIAAATALLSMAACAIVLTIHTASMLDSWATFPARVTALQAAVQKLPKNIIPLVTKPVLAEVDKQTTGIRRDITNLLYSTDRRIGDALGRYDATLHLVDARTGEALRTAAGIRQDLQPTLAASAALVKDAQDSWDDSYDDVRGLLQSGEVAATQTAQTMETVRKEAPQFAGNVNAIAADFHDATHSLDMKFFHPPPRTRKQKVDDFFKGLLPALLLIAERL